MNMRVLQWISSLDGRLVSGATISETPRVFGGEIRVTKTVIVENSPI